MKKSIIKLLIVMMILITTSSCSKKEDDIDKVVMTYVSAPLNVPSIIDKDQSIYSNAYEKMGLDFEYSNLTSGADQTNALASGDIQILNAVGGSSVLLAAANGADIVILSMYSRGPGAFCMFANDKSLNSPESLKGKTIAGPKGTNLHELLVAYLKTSDMSIEDVDFVNMDIPSAVAALDAGSIDVALVGGVASYNLQKAGKYMICDGEGLISAVICTATSRKFADVHPDIIDTFLKKQKEILSYIDGNFDEAMSITATNLDLDVNAVKDMYALYDFNDAITSADIEQLKNTEQFLFDSGLIENHVDVDSLIYN